MKFRRTATTEVEAAPELLPPVTLASRLLPRVFEGIPDRDKLTVLDLGPGRAQTVEYLANLGIPCRVIFVDSLQVIEELKTHDDDNPATFNDALSLWHQHIAVSGQEPIDVVLFWDYLHRFDLMAVEALSTVLQPHMQPHTRGHGFGCLHSDQPIFESHYQLNADLHIIMQRYADLTLPYAHAQQVLNEFFMCLRITKGTLLQKGYLELLFEAGGGERRAPII